MLLHSIRIYDVFVSLLVIWLINLSNAAMADAGSDEKHFHLRVGALAHSVGPLSDGDESGADINLELMFPRNPQTHHYWGRMITGTNLNLNHETSQIYIARAWQLGLPVSLVLEYQFGFSIHNGELDSADSDRRQLGSRLLFRNALELGWRWDSNRISVIYDHASNAGLLEERNQGIDNIGIRLSIGL
ncbi:MAG: acyloxyacyl hydrolase [Halopseudomonas sp.]